MYVQLHSQMHNRVLLGTSVVLIILGGCYSRPVPAIFAFGDSQIDAGNNNYIKTFAKVNDSPYGIDFSGGPTGRFTNGKTILDILGEKLGFKNYIPPYLAPTAVLPVILEGVNYASGAGGILNATGVLNGGRICMDAQLDDFANTRQDIISNIGESAASRLIQKSIFYVAIGGNDLSDYLLLTYPFPSAIRRNIIKEALFIGFVISRFRLQLTRLYNLGARKIIVMNVGPVGCIPIARDLFAVTGDFCSILPNEVAQLFNVKLRSLVDELSSTLRGSKFLYANNYGITQEIIQNYISYGFSNANSACCSLAGRHGGLIPCTRRSKVCPDRSKYVFWDTFHTSEAANLIIAERLLSGNRWEISPMNIWQLLRS